MPSVLYCRYQITLQYMYFISCIIHVLNEWMIYLTAIGCKPGGSVTRWQTEITYNNNNQHQQYIEQTIYPTLGGSQGADRAPS